MHIDQYSAVRTVHIDQYSAVRRVHIDEYSAVRTVHIDEYSEAITTKKKQLWSSSVDSQHNFKQILGVESDRG